MKLLIVESPGKLKTLRKILGEGWRLEASVGHTTELAHDGASKLGFDFLSDRIETRYIPRGTRGQQVLTKLRAAVKGADQVYLAMDPDREGESIAWHLVQQLRLKNFVRVSYTQITERAVRQAIQNPRGLDLPLIHAQRARQCLDKLVGYEVSPLLWNSSGGKSAGRVQSATLHLVCERERERIAFRPEDYWVLHAHYPQGLIAQYQPADDASKGAPGESAPRVRTATAAGEIERTARAHPHVVARVEDESEQRLPPPPLITSSLQQVAGVRLKLAPQRTMQIAQELYEGVGGSSGLITYMRTDAVSLSDEFVADARSWLAANQPAALAEKPRQFRAKAQAQAAHEAIRPTSVAFTPEIARSKLTTEQYQLYKLIWERALASQCKAATLLKGEIEIQAGPTRWIARGMRVMDPGYLVFWKNTEDEAMLPAVRKGQILVLENIKIEKKTTQAPARYSEAKLVQLMERLGIGRPSTYASTIQTLKDRDYVVIDKMALTPTALGMKTDEVLLKAMPDLIDTKFTARMETSLDQIAEGKLGWEKFLCGWNADYLQYALRQARVALAGHPRPPDASGFKTKAKFKSKFRSRAGTKAKPKTGAEPKSPSRPKPRA